MRVVFLLCGRMLLVPCLYVCQLRVRGSACRWECVELVLLVLRQCLRGVFCLQCRLCICIWLNWICEKKYDSTAGCSRNITSCGVYQNLTLALASAATA